MQEGPGRKPRGSSGKGVCPKPDVGKSNLVKPSMLQPHSVIGALFQSFPHLSWGHTQFLVLIGAFLGPRNIKGVHSGPFFPGSTVPVSATPGWIDVEKLEHLAPLAGSKRRSLWPPQSAPHIPFSRPPLRVSFPPAEGQAGGMALVDLLCCLGLAVCSGHSEGFSPFHSCHLIDFKSLW